MKQVIQTIKRDGAEKQIKVLEYYLDHYLRLMGKAMKEGNIKDAEHCNFRLTAIHEELTKLEYFPYKESETRRKS